ncbi:MAG: alpha/beta hydrolase [Thermoplasmata archaeon]|nr:alpha/beta hydrolase [Thermoplasmata archaeon]
MSVPEINHSPREERRDRKFRTSSPLPPPGSESTRAPYSEDTAWLEGLPFRDLSLPLYAPSAPLRMPTLLLFGRQDAPFRYQTYWRLLERFPQATFAILDGAAHRLWSDRPELACALAGDWLDRIEAHSPRQSN